MTSEREPSHTTRDSISPEDKQLFFEQYKLYVETMDRVSARRHSANTFFLSVNTFVVAILGALSATGLGFLGIGWAFFTSAAGILMCYCWYRIVLSYKGLNAGKLSIIHRMEEDLPVALFRDEWEALGHGEDPKKYTPFTHIEMVVPWIFSGLYFILLVWALLELVLRG